MARNSKQYKEPGGIKKSFGLHNLFLQKILTRANFQLAPLNILGTSRFPMDCMKWQHAVFKKSICETNLIIIFLPVKTDGTPYSFSDLLYSSLLFTWTNYFQSNSLSPFSSFKPNYSKCNPFSFLCSFWTKNSKSNSNSTKRFWDYSILCLSYKFTPILQKIPSPKTFLTHKNSLFLLTNSILMPLESKQYPLTPASVLACVDSVDEFRFWC